MGDIDDIPMRDSPLNGGLRKTPHPTTQSNWLQDKGSILPLAHQRPFEHLVEASDTRVYSSVRHGQKLHAAGLRYQDAIRLYAQAKHELINPPTAPSPIKKKSGGSRNVLPKPRRRKDPLPGQIWVSIVHKACGLGNSAGADEPQLRVAGSAEFDPIQIKAWPEMTAKELKSKIQPLVASAMKASECQIDGLRVACHAGMFVEDQTLSDWDVRQEELIFCYVPTR